MIDELTRAIRRMDRRIEQLCSERYLETQRLRQVRGVGPLTALAFVLVLEDPQRFSNSRAVGAYLGLCPKRRDSGDTHRQLGITKAGDALLRQLLVSAGHYIIGPFGPDTDLRRFGLRLADRGGGGATQRAAVAVARKLSVVLHHLWVSGEDYEPLRLTEVTETAQ
jgi:transposase